MTSHLTRPSLITTFALIPLIIAACSSDSLGTLKAPNDDRDVGEPEVDVTHYDADVDIINPDIDTTLRDADAEDTDTDDAPYPPGCHPDRVFEKPATSESPQYNEVKSFDPCTEGYPHGSIRGPSTRDHMMATGAALESWLYPDEYFVTDISHIGCNKWWLPSDHHFVVLLDGEPIPSRIVPVSETYPTIDEIESWEESFYEKHHLVHVEDDVPFHYTVVIPPWAFPETGAYNIVTRFFPAWEASPQARYLSTSLGVGPNSATPLLSTVHTIYYGDTCLRDYSDEIPDRQDEAVQWENTDPGSFTGRLNLMFLAPSLDLCDWVAMDGPDKETCLSEVLTIDEPSITIDFYVAGSNRLSVSDTTDTNLYYVMRDAEVIDQFLLDPGDYDYGEIVTGQTKALTLPIDLELTEKPQAYKIVAFPEPFQAQKRDEDRNIFIGNRPVESNSLLLQYDPD